MIRIFYTRGRWILWLLFALAVVVQFIGLYRPSFTSGAPPFPHADKVVHVAMFAAVAATGRWVPIPAPVLVTALLAHAGISEVVQEFLITGRAGDVYDAVADVVGIGLGWIVGGWVVQDQPAQLGGVTSAAPPQTDPAP